MKIVKIFLLPFLITCCLIALLFVLSFSEKPPVVTEETKIALGTFFQIKIEGRKNSQTILKESFELINNLEQKLSIFRPGSEISRLNKIKKSQLSPETVEVIKKAIEISKITDGAFDITCKPLIDLYKKCQKEKRIPTKNEIQKSLMKVGWKNVEIKGNTVYLKNNSEIDLGGIAKGYIVDKVAEFLQSKGIKYGLVNAGGDIYCWGEKPNNEKWKIGIRNPFNTEEIIGEVVLSNRAIATSGDYEQYIGIKGRKFSHIVNPKTGKTIQDFPVSVSVIAPDCTTADGLATGFFVLGKEKAIELANKIDGIEVLVIEINKKIYMSKKFPLINFSFPQI